MTRTKKAAAGAFTGFVQHLALVMLQVFLTPVILKQSGQEVFGAYVIFMQIIGFGLLLDFGLSVALTRYLSQSFNRENNQKKIKDLFNAGRVFLILINVLFSFLVVAIAFNVELIFGGSTEIILAARSALFIFAIWTLIRAPLLLYQHAVLASQNMAAGNIIALTASIFRASLSMIFIYAGLGLLGLVYATIISEILALVILRIYFKNKYPLLDLSWKRTDRSLMKKLAKFGISYWGVNISIALTTGVDSMIVGAVHGASAAAIFYTTKMPAFLCMLLIYKIADNAAPAANELVSVGKLDALRLAYVKLAKYSLLLALPLSIGVVTFNEEIITIWVGSEQFAGNLMSTSLAIYIISQVLNHLNAVICLAVGKIRHWTYISILSAIISIVMSYALTEMFGIQWVMLTIALLDMPVFIFLMHRSFCLLSLPFSLYLSVVIRPVLLSSLPLMGWGWFVIETDGMQDIFGLSLSIGIYFAFWLMGTYLIGLNTTERNQVKNVVSRTVKFFFVNYKNIDH